MGFVETCTTCARLDGTDILGAENCAVLGVYAASKRGGSLKLLVMDVLYEILKCFTCKLDPTYHLSVTDCQPCVS